jgi:hypothetical protein
MPPEEKIQDVTSGDAALPKTQVRSVDIDISDNEPPDSDQEPDVSEPEPQTRRQRRAARGATLLSQTRQELEEERRKREEVSRTMDEMRQRYENDIGQIRQQLAARQQDTEDPLEAQINAASQEREEAFRGVRDGMPAEEVKSLVERGRKAERKYFELIAEKQAKKHTPPPVNQEALSYQVRYSDVINDKQAYLKADALYRNYLAEGETGGPALIERSLEDARKWKQNRNKDVPPHPADRSRLTGRSPGPAVGDVGKISIAAADVARYQAMADQMYPYINSSPESQKAHGHKGDGAQERLRLFAKEVLSQKD